jgi:hypothetical protein
VFENKAAKAKYLSKSLIALWVKADARTRKGDGGPVGFDPITNSRAPDVKSFKIVAEKQETDKAVIAVTIDSHQGPPPKPADQTIRYDFAREAGGWKIARSKVPSTARHGRSAPYLPTSSNIRALRDGLPIPQDRQATTVNYCGWLASS